MRSDKKLLWIFGAVAVAMIAWPAMLIALFFMSLEPGQRTEFYSLVMSGLPLLGLIWMLAWIMVVATFKNALSRHLSFPGRLEEHTRILLHAQASQKLFESTSPEWTRLAVSINDLAQQRDNLQTDMDARVASSNVVVQQEKDRLVALVSELSQSVVVCNLDGLIVLFNNRARLQLKVLSRVSELTHGVEHVGVGRSIYKSIDQKLIAHAIDSIRLRLARGAAYPSAQFISGTRSGQLMRIQLAPVQERDEVGGLLPNLTGYVLLLDNVTKDIEEDVMRNDFVADALKHGELALMLAERAVDFAAAHVPKASGHSQTTEIFSAEIANMKSDLSSATARAARHVKTTWALNDAMGADFLSMVETRLRTQHPGIVVASESSTDVWLRIDTFAVLTALTYLAGRVVNEVKADRLLLRLLSDHGKVHLDLVWFDRPFDSGDARKWAEDDIEMDGVSMAMTADGVFARHGGSIDVGHVQVRQEAYFRVQLPLTKVDQQEKPGESTERDGRPVFYDFDLFRATDETRLLQDRPLSSLTYTVFDTETTGLNPSTGDEIIQIGAVRIVNGKLLGDEYFDQLVNPGRSIPSASVAIHGITQEMVSGKPMIEKVLTAFHAYSQDSILVAHNAAFDMKFLQLKQSGTGLVFDQPVLDTLLLSAVLHPNQPSHALESIAERLNVEVIGRHTALGDATVTAMVLLRLIAQLKDVGICTLGEAIQASRKTSFSRLKY